MEGEVEDDVKRRQFILNVLDYLHKCHCWNSKSGPGFPAEGSAAESSELV